MGKLRAGHLEHSVAVAGFDGVEGAGAQACLRSRTDGKAVPGGCDCDQRASCAVVRFDEGLHPVHKVAGLVHVQGRVDGHALEDRQACGNQVLCGLQLACGGVVLRVGLDIRIQCGHWATARENGLDGQVVEGRRTAAGNGQERCVRVVAEQAGNVRCLGLSAPPRPATADNVCDADAAARPCGSRLGGPQGAQDVPELLVLAAKQDVKLGLVHGCPPKWRVPWALCPVAGHLPAIPKQTKGRHLVDCIVKVDGVSKVAGLQLTELVENHQVVAGQVQAAFRDFLVQAQRRMAGVHVDTAAELLPHP